MGDANAGIRQAAAKSLGKLNAPQAVELLLATLRDADASVRQAAAGTLGELKDPRAVEPLIAALRDDNEWVRWATEDALIVNLNGAYRRDQQGQLQGFVAVVTDITERNRLQEMLREQTIRDPLTGLFNRRYLDETLPRELSRYQRNGELLVVAMLDLDHFKHFNDTYGHEAGDAVLRTVGDLLGRSLRAGDLACRYGGEELTLILHGSTLEDAQLRLDGLRRAIRQTSMAYRGGELPAITVSIGVTAAESAEIDAATLLSRADAALYQAKAQGRDRVVAAVGGQAIE